MREWRRLGAAAAFGDARARGVRREARSLSNYGFECCGVGLERWKVGSAIAGYVGMARDHTKLRVFEMSDALAFDIYQATKKFPREERFALQSQIRRAGLSVPTNIVEGCARLTERAYCNFCDIALGSACETRYLIEFSWRLQYFDEATYERLHKQSDAVVRSLSRLVGVLDQKRRDRRLARLAKRTAALDRPAARKQARR